MKAFPHILDQNFLRQNVFIHFESFLATSNWIYFELQMLKKSLVLTSNCQPADIALGGFLPMTCVQSTNPQDV